MDSFSFLGNSEINAMDGLYQQYLNDPGSVDRSWQDFFKGFEFARKSYGLSSGIPEILDKEFKVIRLIEDYRRRGHFFTRTNPVRTRRKYFPTLDIENYGLAKEDLPAVFQAGTEIGIGPASLSQIVDQLETTYCQSIGAEYTYIRDAKKISWLKNRMEGSRNTPDFSTEKKKQIYNLLKQGVGFEKFIHKKFVGQKRFSLEGTETLIPALHELINHGSGMGIREFVIGMSHRGRLNVLANILKKPYEIIFKEFVANEYEESVAQGDVKYHLGYNSQVHTDDGVDINLSLAPNPSHLETVVPVIEGISRSKIDHTCQEDYSKLVPVAIHGDAAVAAQGIVYEVIQMSELPGYRAGGTVHIIINNQVGFTTNYLEGRSSTYCTDIAKVTKCPVFHINGDDVEALVFATRMAIEYRQEFQSDVFIDILSYRKYGHNEGDEPRFTQPLLYKAIATHPNPRDIYSQKLTEQGVFTAEETKLLDREFDDFLESKFALIKNIKRLHIKQYLEEDWKGFIHPVTADFFQPLKTGVPVKKLLEIAGKINTLPSDLQFFNKTIKLVEERAKMIENGKVDWAMAELLAYGSLVAEGMPVRLSGQDSVRGTFSHRHAAHVIEDTDDKYFPMNQLSSEKASFKVYNSHLSEYGVLGFEYGYALATPHGLTIWEAQFGDFHNVAQVIIDQYISSAEEKWGLMNGIVLYLPHGYEGQGPEHSSARIERFLTMAANNNMQIANCTTPANLFHILRRQMLRNFRVPLVIFTPKSLLRHPKCISALDELQKGSFREVIDDDNVDVDEVRRVIFCSGKIYYDLLAKKEDYNARDIALVRIEQLHPLPVEQMKAIVKKYKNALIYLWVQEEPENMGAWRYISYNFRDVPLVQVSRLASGSPAVGLHELHEIGQDEIISKVFRHCDCEMKNKYCGLHCVKGMSRKEIMKQFNYIYR